MSEYYMTVMPDSQLHKDYFQWEKDSTAAYEIFERMRKKFGIESKQCYARKDTLAIVPTKGDLVKFQKMMLKDKKTFRKNCEISKTWASEVKDLLLHKPSPIFYCKSGAGRTSTRLFNIENVLYCMMCTEEDVEFPAFGCEIKGSEFYSKLESMNEDQ